MTFQAPLHSHKERCNSQEYFVFFNRSLTKEGEVILLEVVEWENTKEHLDTALDSKRKSLISLARGVCNSQVPPPLNIRMTCVLHLKSDVLLSDLHGDL